MGVIVRPHPDLLPFVFATFRRDRSGAEGEGGQEKEQRSCAAGRFRVFIVIGVSWTSFK